MPIKTANELEGFIVDQCSQKLATSLNGQRIDRAIFSALDQRILPYLSTEEFACHFEIKNPIPQEDSRDAVAEISNIIILIRDFLNRNNLDIVFQALPPVTPSKGELTADYLTDNAQKLMKEQGWTMDILKQTLISGFQVNRDIPQEIQEAGLELEYTRNLYNFTSSNYPSVMSMNNSPERQKIIEPLLSQGDGNVFEDSSFSYAPGNFNGVSDMQEYFRLKLGASSLQDMIRVKHLHSLTLKPKGPETSIEDFIPTYIEYRFADAIDVSSYQGSSEAKRILTFITGIESMVTDKTLNPSSSQSHQIFPMVPHPLDR